MTGNIQRHEAFSSRFLSNEREILVYLPVGYRRSISRRYPVLYLQDGQNVFDAATAFGGVEWRVDETAQRLIKQHLIEPLIIVAIAHAGEKRQQEYTPKKGQLLQSRNTRGLRGASLQKYGRFVVEEVKPFIDRTYRTLSEKESTGIGGSSLGGLASLVLGFWYPEIFTRIAALSPSVWWEDCAIYRLVEQMDKLPRSSRIWLDTGTGEEGWERVVHLRDLLGETGWRLYGNLEYREVVGAEHNEAAWAERFEGVLRYLYPPIPPGLRKARQPLIVTRPV